MSRTAVPALSAAAIHRPERLRTNHIVEVLGTPESPAGTGVVSGCGVQVTSVQALSCSADPGQPRWKRDGWTECSTATTACPSLCIAHGLMHMKTPSGTCDNA